ncbi:MAG TPA: deoxyhypusine synthase family protein [Chloroflexota bacterium]|nr:deoxyhypusine synthase family protein [Chloroflexota bacterium]
MQHEHTPEEEEAPMGEETTGLLDQPTTPFTIDSQANVRDALLRMAATGFQGRNLGRALQVWERMKASNAFVFLGISGALVPAGMREAICWLVANEYVHCVVSTGAQLFHDLHETLGYKNYQGRPDEDDTRLRELRIDRMYDIYASELEFQTIDQWVAALADRAYPTETVVGTPEFFRLLGREAIARNTGVEGIITTCYRKNVPIFSPALGDSSIGLALAFRQAKGEHGRLLFDIIGDVIAMAHLVDKAERTGVVFLGGGTPKNYIQQAEVALEYITGKDRGHDFGIQITTDAPHWGGLSGCTFRESESWGKYNREAVTATVYTDATIALPLLVTALSQGQKHR